MELKVGMYVKTDGGIIDKVAIDYNGRCNSPYCNCKHISCEHDYYDEDNIVKSSENIIDLLEVGDYVNGYKVSSIYNPTGDGIFNFTLITENGYQTINPYIKKYIVKSVVTKEQFDSIKYEVE